MTINMDFNKKEQHAIVSVLIAIMEANNYEQARYGGQR